jgi:hypothetical protein
VGPVKKFESKTKYTNDMTGILLRNFEENFSSSHSVPDSKEDDPEEEECSWGDLNEN